MNMTTMRRKPSSAASLDRGLGEDGDGKGKRAAEDAAGGALVRSVCLASAAGVVFGYNLGIWNGAGDALAAAVGIADSALKQGVVVSTLLAGAFFGSAFGGAISERLGRRGALVLVVSVTNAVGSLLIAASTGASAYASVVLGRLVAGVGVGVSSAVLPTYISEISPSSVRGALGVVTQISICGGILFAVLVSATRASWRWLFALGVPISCVLAMLILCPESPRWLQRRGRAKEARAAAAQLWPSSQHAALDEESGAGGETAPEGGGAAPAPDRDGEAAGAGREDSILSGRYRHSLVVAIALFTIQQLSGINGAAPLALSPTHPLARSLTGSLARSPQSSCTSARPSSAPWASRAP